MTGAEHTAVLLPRHGEAGTACPAAAVGGRDGREPQAA